MGSDGVTWSYWSHGVIWLGEVGAGIPEFWGQMELGRSVMGAGRVRESQGHVGVWFPSGLWVTCSHGVTHIQRDEIILGYGSCEVMAQGPTFGHKDAQSPLRMN